MTSRMLARLVCICLLVGGTGCVGGKPEAESGAGESPVPSLGLRPDGDTDLRPNLSQASDELREIFDFIDTHLDEHVGSLQRWIQQPGIADTEEGIPESVDLVKDLFERLGCQQVESHEVGETEWGVKANPIVYARCDVGAPRTLLMYWRYDTYPVTRPDAWEAPPFAGLLRARPPFKKVLIGRGASRSKGPQMVAWNALMSIKAVTGTLPVNLIAVAGGDEERLSIGLRKFVRADPGRFAEADALWAVGGQSSSGRAAVRGGSEGLVSFELTTSGARWGRGPTRGPIHGRNARAVDNPAWRHMRMLESLVSADDNRAKVDGFYDDIEPLTNAQVSVLEEDAKSLNLEAVRLRTYPDGTSEDPVEYLKRVRYGASFDLEGIWGGNTISGGGGALVPSEITSRHAIRYVPRQDGLELVNRIRRHLDRGGYQDVELTLIGDMPWCKMELTSDLTTAQTRALDTFQIPYTPPRLMEARRVPSWPAYLFGREPLQLPISSAGAGLGRNAELPNEYYVIEGAGGVYGFAAAEKLQATVLYNFAGKN